MRLKKVISAQDAIAIERDMISKMPFAPQVHDPDEMDASIFRPEPMGLRDRFLDIHIDDRISYDAEKNTLFLNFAGMRVRNEADLAAILRRLSTERWSRSESACAPSLTTNVSWSMMISSMNTLDLVKYVEDEVLHRFFPLLQQRIFAARIRQRARKTRSFLQGYVKQARKLRCT